MLNKILFYIKNINSIQKEIFAAIVVALALIPEAISFSIIAGVDPRVGLYASFCIAIITAIFGGRPAMISAATGAMALAMVTLVKQYGLEYLLAATILTGFFQILSGIFRLGDLMRFVSKSVITGFVNALAILIFLAQLPEFKNAGIEMYCMVVLGLGIIYLFPYFTKSLPSPLVCIIFLTIISIVFKFDLRTVGDMGKLPDSFPKFLFPNIPLNFETLKIIFPYSVTLAAIGLLESLMTATIVDDMTETSSNKNRECIGQGLGNIVAGLFGGMAGCAMIGQSVINVKSGGRTRLSTFLAGLFLLLLILFMDKFIIQIPMAALVAVMIMVSISTFNWESVKNLKTNPKASSFVMISTVIVVVWSHNLALGVFVGVLMSVLFFARKISHLVCINSKINSEKNSRTYYVNGQIFFASSGIFLENFNFDEKIENIIIDLKNAHFWDISSISALDKVVLRFKRKNINVELIGANKETMNLIEKFAIYNKENSCSLNFENH